MRKLRHILIACAMMAGAACSVYASAQEDPASPLPTDAAKLYRIYHEITYVQDGADYLPVADGKKLQAGPPRLIDSQYYIPVRTLEQAGAVQVSWNGVRKEVRLIMHPHVQHGQSDVRFVMGAASMLSARSSSEWVTLDIPKPFLFHGRAYVPLQALSHLGFAISYHEGVPAITWSESRLDILQPKFATAEHSVRLSILAEPSMNAPTLKTPHAGIGWAVHQGSASGFTEVDGRTYERFQYELPLIPGYNPIRVTAGSTGEATVEVLRNVQETDNLHLAVLDTDAVQFQSPSEAYVEVKAGQSVAVKGNTLYTNPLFDRVTVTVRRYEPEELKYHETGRVTFPIHQQLFDGDVIFEEPGYYIVTIYSPAYIPFPNSEPAKTTWAEFVVRAAQ